MIAALVASIAFAVACWALYLAIATRRELEALAEGLEQIEQLAAPQAQKKERPHDPAALEEARRVIAARQARAGL